MPFKSFRVAYNPPCLKYGPLASKMLPLNIVRLNDISGGETEDRFLFLGTVSGLTL
jgi:hypothetical protein